MLIWELRSREISNLPRWKEDQMLGPWPLGEGFTTTSEHRLNARAFVYISSPRGQHSSLEHDDCCSWNLIPELTLLFTLLSPSLLIYSLSPLSHLQTCHHSAPKFPHLTFSLMIFTDSHICCYLADHFQKLPVALIPLLSCSSNMSPRCPSYYTSTWPKVTSPPSPLKPALTGLVNGSTILPVT